MTHKSTEGIGIEDVRKAVEAADTSDDVVLHDYETAQIPETEDDKSKDSSKIVKAAIGGVAAGALLAGIYELAHHRLSKKKEQ